MTEPATHTMSTCSLLATLTIVLTLGQSCRNAPLPCGSCNPTSPALTEIDRTRIDTDAFDLDAHLTYGRELPKGYVWSIAETWQELPAGNGGKWELFKPVDTSGYVDTTADGKGRIIASGEGFPKEKYGNAFDDTPGKWCIKTPTIWIEYHYPEGVHHRVVTYTLTAANDAPQRDPRDWQLLGSNDGKVWTVVDERKNQSFTMRFQKRLFKVGQPGEYAAYRLNVTRNHGADTSQLSEIELFVPGK